MDNSVTTSKTIGNIRYSVRYEPVELQICKAYKRKLSELDEQTIEKEKEKRENLQYFTMTLSTEDQSEDILKYNLNSTEDYYNRIEYLSSYFGQDIYLVENNDTLPCALFLFERNYNLSPDIKLNLAFKQSGKQGKISDKQFIYQDNIFNTGTIKLVINSSQLKRIPKLKTTLK